MSMKVGIQLLEVCREQKKDGKMKARTDFVTNSSTSNFILGIKPNLTLWSIREGLRKLEEKGLLDDLPVKDDIYGFAVSLTAHAIGNSILQHLKSEDKMVLEWNERFQKEQNELVEKFGEDAAFMHELERWDRVFVEDVRFPIDELDASEIGIFPKRALELVSKGYAVYMFSASDWFDGFLADMRTWGGTSKKIVSDDLVIWVETYY